MSFRIQCIALAAAMVALGLGSGASATVIVRFEPSMHTAMMDDVFSIDIVADMPDPISGWGLDMDILDGAITSLTGPPAIGPAWFAAFTPDGDDLGGLAFPDAVSGTGVVLATLTFSADSIGCTDLELSDDNPADLTEGFLLEPAGFADAAYEPGTICVIPEPATIVFLVFSAVALTYGLRRGFS